MRGASHDGAHPGLHSKPLDAAIGRVLASHRRGGHHGRRLRINTQNTNKTQLLASKYSTFRALLISENFIPQNRPSNQLRNATIGAEKLAVISSYQTFSADKSKKVINRSRSSLKSWAHICAHRG